MQTMNSLFCTTTHLILTFPIVPLMSYSMNALVNNSQGNTPGPRIGQQPPLSGRVHQWLHGAQPTGLRSLDLRSIWDTCFASTEWTSDVSISVSPLTHSTWYSIHQRVSALAMRTSCFIKLQRFFLRPGHEGYNSTCYSVRILAHDHIVHYKTRSVSFDLTRL